MREYFIRSREGWRHFFMKPSGGLCYRSRLQGRFSGQTLLVPEACEDFCALSTAGQVHLVCQDRDGSVLYVAADGSGWKKTVLLKSKSAASFPKYFSLVPVGGFLNLFYLISYRDKAFLAHQILGAGDGPPAIVDSLTPGRPPFIAVPGEGTDLTVLYDNEAGLSGTRLYRWSEKSFRRFVPVNPAAGCLVRGLRAEPDGRLRYAARRSLDAAGALVYFEKRAEGSYSVPVVLAEDCPRDAEPIFCVNGAKLFVVWKDQSGILSVCSADGGRSWGAPVRYVKNAALAPVLYTICDGDRCRQAYGFEKDGGFVFCGAPPLFGGSEAEQGSRLYSAGYGAEALTRHAGRWGEGGRTTGPNGTRPPAVQNGGPDRAARGGKYADGKQENGQLNAFRGEAADSFAVFVRRELNLLKGQLQSLSFELRSLQETLRRPGPVSGLLLPAVRGKEPVVREQEPVVREQEPVVREQEPAVREQEPAVRGKESVVASGETEP